MANKVRLTICGSSYVISTNESEDYMQNLAERLNLDMNELMSSSNSVLIAFMPRRLASGAYTSSVSCAFFCALGVLT